MWYCTHLADLFGKVNLDSDTQCNLLAYSIVIGHKYPYLYESDTIKYENSAKLLDKTTIISRNCCFNNFAKSSDDHIHHWRNYILQQFSLGIHAVCLQDFPYSQISHLERPGHMVYLAYAIADTGGLIVNIIIINPKFVSKFEFEETEVSYLSERSTNNPKFASGTLLVCLKDKKLTLGSHYSYHTTKARSRAIEMTNRFSFIYDLNTINKSDLIICGDFNPRTLSRLTDETSLERTKRRKHSILVYNLKLICFIIFSLLGITPLQELKKYSRYGIICPNTSTIKDKSFGPITLPASKLNWTFDAVQTILPSSKIMIQVCSGDDLSDHYPIQITIQ